MKKIAIILLLGIAISAAAEAPWQKREGRFALLETPAAMTKDVHHRAIDSLQEVYRSPDISLCFESETGILPAVLQANFEEAVAVWSKRNKQSTLVRRGSRAAEVAAGSKQGKQSTFKAVDDKSNTPVEVDDKTRRHIACFYQIYDPKYDPRRPYYLYFGFSAGDGFYVHLSFRSLADLDDVERILKSVHLKCTP